MESALFVESALKLYCFDRTEEMLVSKIWKFVIGKKCCCQKFENSSSEFWYFDYRDEEITAETLWPQKVFKEAKKPSTFQLGEIKKDSELINTAMIEQEKCLTLIGMSYESKENAHL